MTKLASIKIPPYGILPRQFNPDESTQPPNDFLFGSTSNRQDAKNDFIIDRCDYVAKKYWPVWDYAAADWKPNKATAHMEAFSRQDIDWLLTLRPALASCVTIDGANVYRTHADCFVTEDTRNSKASTAFDEFKYYLPSIHPRQLDHYLAVFESGINNKVGAFPLHINTHTQDSIRL
jgi:hypothetical protein